MSIPHIGIVKGLHNSELVPRHEVDRVLDCVSGAQNVHLRHAAVLVQVQFDNDAHLVAPRVAYAELFLGLTEHQVSDFGLIFKDSLLDPEKAPVLILGTDVFLVGIQLDFF